MNSEEIAAQICSDFDRVFWNSPSQATRDSLRLRFLGLLKQQAPEVAFDTLIWILERENHYQHQLLAGELLALANVSCHRSLDDVLRRILPTYNSSANSVVNALQQLFGKEALLECLHAISKTESNETTLNSIRTMRYWMHDL